MSAALDEKIRDRDPDDVTLVQPRRPTRVSIPSIAPAERRTRIAMIVVGLVIWLAAIAWPGWSLPGLLLGAVMVAWATFGLLTE